jgi:hypothetical protein
MGSQNRQPTKAKPPIADDVSQPPFETEDLRGGIQRLLDEKFTDSKTGSLRRIGSFQFGVYAFYDYDGEPIYVGQTRESLGTRVRRHLTNQRTDAVAMSVLDPFEVCDVQLWPLPELDGLSEKDPKIQQRLDGLESTIYEAVLKESEFKAVLNEKIPIYHSPTEIPISFRGRIVSDEVMKVRGHPDIRLARRAATISRLAQIVSERKVAVGLRRVLVVQAERLLALADRRFKHFAADPETDDEDDTL